MIFLLLSVKLMCLLF